MTTLLERVDWSAVNRDVRREVRNREVHCPPISLFRWWARRPHALTRALLVASELKARDLVSDPFSGGGTVTLEALANGNSVYAQDLNPWPIWGLKTALDGVPQDLLKKGIDSFWKEFRESAAQDYATDCPVHEKSEILNVFWVRECFCEYCKQSLYLYPYSLITLASRRKTERVGFYGCSSCGHITKGGTVRQVVCGFCSRRLSAPREQLLARKRVNCPHCSEELPAKKTWSRKPTWRPVLVQRSCRYRARHHVHFALPTEREIASAFFRVNIPDALLEPIPVGSETSVLRRGGFKQWQDLYPARQLAVLLKATQVARDLKLDPRVSGRIQLAIAGAGEMAGHLCRWDRFHPKAFEALSNHRFAVLGLAVETNLAAEQGRGTLKRRLMNSLKAAQWAEEHFGVEGTPGHCVESTHRPTRIIVSGSSSKQLISSNSVRLVITDPPYYGAVQYGELSALFLAWAKVVSGKRRGWEPNLRLEAVPNATRKSGPELYGRLLRAIMKETARTMRSDARLLLTYHSTDFRGWAALGGALQEAGLRVIGLAVAHSENEKDHPKRNRNGFFKDLIIECQKTRRGVATSVVTFLRDNDQRELVAAGLTIAKFGGTDYEEMAQEFLHSTRRLKRRRIRVPNSGSR